MRKESLSYWYVLHSKNPLGTLVAQSDHDVMVVRLSPSWASGQGVEPDWNSLAPSASFLLEHVQMHALSQKMFCLQLFKRILRKKIMEASVVS